MFFSFVVALFLAVSFVFASPHALHHHALHHRAIAAQVAREPSPNNATVARRRSPQCNNPKPPSTTQVLNNRPHGITSISSFPPQAMTPTPPSQTSSIPAPSPSSISSTPHQTFTDGDGTFYATGLNACGTTDHDADYICAVSRLLFDQYQPATDRNPNHNPLCQRNITAHYQGKTVKLRITDRCEGCDNPHSLDMSPSAFTVLADPAIGRIHGLSWSFDEP